jgi:hypothetical protein
MDVGVWCYEAVGWGGEYKCREEPQEISSLLLQFRTTAVRRTVVAVVVTGVPLADRLELRQA